MEILTILGILLVVAVLFVGGGLFGWLLKGVEVLFSFLGKGCGNTMGCLFWLFVGFVLLLGLLF